MARGWESKSVDDQMQAAEQEKAARGKPLLSAEDAARRARRAGLLLSRASIVRNLEAAKDHRYREQLQQALAHLDRQLGEDDDGSP